MTQKQILHVLRTMSAEAKKKYLLNLLEESRSEFFHMLEFLSEEEQDKWIDAYAAL